MTTSYYANFLEDFGREVMTGEYPMDSASGQDFVDAATEMKRLKEIVDQGTHPGRPSMLEKIRNQE